MSKHAFDEIAAGLREALAHARGEGNGAVWRYWRVTRPDGPWVFPGRGHATHVSKRAVQYRIAKVVARSGIRQRCAMHTLRHSFATHQLERGVDGVRSAEAEEGVDHVVSKAVVVPAIRTKPSSGRP